MRRYVMPVSANGTFPVPEELPARFGTSAILGLGQDRCLALYTLDQWTDFLARLDRLPPPMTRRLRVLTDQTVQVCLTDGTLQLPPYLRQYAGITSVVEIVLDEDSCRLFSTTL